MGLTGRFLRQGKNPGRILDVPCSGGNFGNVGSALEHVLQETLQGCIVWSPMVVMMGEDDLGRQRKLALACSGQSTLRGCSIDRLLIHKYSRQLSCIRLCK